VAIRINEQLEMACDLLKPDAEKKGLTLSYQKCSSEEDAVITTDSEKFYSIITNLLKNAIKYTDRGSVEFGYTRKKEFLEFYVRDTGVGIPENRLEAIFERFVQAEGVVLQARQGAGLGLSITKAYVEMLGGKIRVESEVGKGTVFYFTLPFRVQGEFMSQIENTFSGTGVAPQDKKLKILMTEDDETSQMLLSVLLQEFSKDILIAKTGMEAIEIYHSNPDIDLILMDIQMPEIDGYEATRQIRKLSKQVLIIAQTAYGIMGDWEKAIDAGCDDYMTKPISQDTLTEMINKYFPR